MNLISNCCLIGDLCEYKCIQYFTPFVWNTFFPDDIKVLINEYKNSTEEDQVKLISFLSIEDSIKLLTTMHSIINTIYDKKIMHFANVTYNIINKRITNIKNNKMLSCSKKEKQKLENLYIMLLENKPVKSKVKRR